MKYLVSYLEVLIGSFRNLDYEELYRILAAPSSTGKSLEVWLQKTIAPGYICFFTQEKENVSFRQWNDNKFSVCKAENCKYQDFIKYIEHTVFQVLGSSLYKRNRRHRPCPLGSSLSCRRLEVNAGHSQLGETLRLSLLATRESSSSLTSESNLVPVPGFHSLNML